MRVRLETKDTYPGFIKKRKGKRNKKILNLNFFFKTWDSYIYIMYVGKGKEKVGRKITKKRWKNNPEESNAYQ